jgi:hypothetical protein
VRWLRSEYPAVAEHLAPFEAPARRRGDKGQFWWELRPCDYYTAFEQPKIVYPDIAKSNRFHMDPGGLYSANTTYLIPVEDWFLLGILNSAPIWFALAGISIPFGERAGEFRYRLFTQYMQQLPIPDAGEGDRQAIAELARSCGQQATERYELQSKVQRRLLQAFGARRCGSGDGPVEPEGAAVVDAVAERIGPGAEDQLQVAHQPVPKPALGRPVGTVSGREPRAVDRLTRSLADAEADLNDRVYALFHLTPDEIKLLQREVEH